MSRKIPITSRVANNNFTSEQRQTHYNKIVEAIKVLKLANGYEIAKYLKMEHVQINRRLHEMRKAENPKIYITEKKHATTQGNSGYCYALVGDDNPQSIYESIQKAGEKVEKDLPQELKDAPVASNKEQGEPNPKRQGSFMFDF